MLSVKVGRSTVRELENVLQRAIILASGVMVRAEDLPSHLVEEMPSQGQHCIAGGSFERQLREYKIKLAEKAVHENDGNKTLAAHTLGVSRAYLHRLLRLERDAAAPQVVTGEVS